MRIRTAAALLVAAGAMAVMAACDVTSTLFRQYEYEEEMYLSLDGSAMLYVNSSIPALNALRGSTFNADPAAAVDVEAVRAFFTSPVTRVTRVKTSSRRNRRYVHVRMEVDDVRHLGQAGPLSWSSYQFGRQDELFVYKQLIAGPKGSVPDLLADDITAFRIHIPSKIVWHNAGSANLKRGNILVWEQPLPNRLRGEPLDIEARMESQSILYRTLFLFAGTLVAVAIVFVAVIWWILRHGAATAARAGGSSSDART